MNHVNICLSTFNGAIFLEKQLASFLEQTHQNWSLLVSDDGSTDTTQNIIAQFVKSNPSKQIFYVDGPRQGYVKNFLSMLCHENAVGDYFAFADQDDIWLPEKLETAVHQLNQISNDAPKLYGGRTIIIDSNDNKVNLSPLFKRDPTFLNALVQNFAGGNTMLFNKEAKTILQNIGSEVTVISHDWWAYQVISGAGGNVIYDPTPQVLYRNHGMNIIGSNQGLRARGKRILAVLSGQYAGWNDINVAELKKNASLLHPQNKITLDQFEQFRHCKGMRAVINGRKMGLYRQTFFGTLTLYLACFFGKA